MTESEKTAVENLFQLISAMTREQQERLLLYGDFSAAASALMDCAGSPKWQRWHERVKRAQGVQE